jgi:prepilin-type N-terminal cleavage/methylation domain-containing protein
MNLSATHYPSGCQGTAAGPQAGRRCPAFTLIELLVVMGIIGVLMFVAMPGIKSITKGDSMSAATRQLTDEVARARRLAISWRTSVYMVFVKPEFWTDPQFAKLNATEKALCERLLDNQYSGYALFTWRRVGEQPGMVAPVYLTEWKSLPRGVMFPEEKFDDLGEDERMNLPIEVRPFHYPTNGIPFPTADSPEFSMPAVRFDYQGRAVSARKLGNYEDEMLQLASGSIFYPMDQTNKVSLFQPADYLEVRPGDWTNNFSRVRIDWLTGRTKVERPEIR